MRVSEAHRAHAGDLLEDVATMRRVDHLEDAGLVSVQVLGAIYVGELARAEKRAELVPAPQAGRLQALDDGEDRDGEHRDMEIEHVVVAVVTAAHLFALLAPLLEIALLSVGLVLLAGRGIILVGVVVAAAGGE